MAYLPTSASYDERMVALAKRLGYVIARDPSAFTSTHWIRLWAWVGTELADKEPEFSAGPGRPLGRRTKTLSSNVTKAALRKRREREKKAAQNLLMKLVRDKN